MILTIKRTGRSGSSRATIAYALDYDQKHKKGIDPNIFENKELLNSRDPELINNNARAITVASVNCNPYDPEPEFRHERLRWDKNQNKNQCATYVLAADDQTWQELGKFLANRDHNGDLTSVKEIEKYREWGRMSLEVGELIAGNGDRNIGRKNYQIAVQTHADEHGMHSHFEINSINMNTGKKLNYTNDDLLKIYEYADDIYRSRSLSVRQAGLERIYNPDTGKYITQSKKASEGENLSSGAKTILKNKKYSYTADLINRFENAVFLDMNKDNSKASVIEKLKKQGITVDQWDNSHKYIKLHWDALKYDVKSHGKVTQKKGSPSKSIRIKGYTRQEIDHWLTHVDDLQNSELNSRSALSSINSEILIDKVNKSIADFQNWQKSASAYDQQNGVAGTKNAVVYNSATQKAYTYTEWLKNKPKVPDTNLDGTPFIQPQPLIQASTPLQKEKSQPVFSNKPKKFTELDRIELINNYEKSISNNPDRKALVIAYSNGLNGDTVEEAKENAMKAVQAEQNRLFFERSNNINGFELE